MSVPADGASSETAAARGALYVVSTPIGNLADITFRAVDVLRDVDGILAEDTRHSRRLLDRYAIRTPVEALHEHNEARRVSHVLDRLRAGARLALVSDAGTPLLSDPGARLVRACAEQGLRVVPVPGASALLSALVATGFDTERFTFFGFLPRAGRRRATALEAVDASEHTSVVYEAPARVASTLRELSSRSPDRAVAVARELTKQFEEIRRGTAAALAAYYTDAPPRGEVVLVVAGRPSVDAPAEDAIALRARELLDGGASVRDVAAALARELGVSRNVAYRITRDTRCPDSEADDAQ